MARDATARLYDVQNDSVVLTQKEDNVKYATGMITFSARKGRLVDLDKLHESIWATRLSGGTRMALKWLEVTAVGDVAVTKKKVILKVKGSTAHFVLADDPTAGARDGEETPLARLRKALDRGERIVSVTGRVDGWSGRFPVFLGNLPKKPRKILVKDFKTAG